MASSCQFNSLVCPTSILALKFKYSTEVRQQVDIIFDKSLCEFYKWFVGFPDAEARVVFNTSCIKYKQWYRKKLLSFLVLSYIKMIWKF